MKLVALKRAGGSYCCTAAVAGAAVLLLLFDMRQRMMISGLVMMISRPMMMITGVVNGGKESSHHTPRNLPSWSSNPVQLLALGHLLEGVLQFGGVLWLFSSHFRALGLVLQHRVLVGAMTGVLLPDIF